MNGKFTLAIELGNAEMRKPEDVAAALTDVAERLRRGQDEGRIRDLNGNTVGRFDLAGIEDNTFTGIGDDT